jgi:hypothetical protein
MGKYEPLGIFLRGQRADRITLTFSQIEKITGNKLPPKAQHHRAWWSNNPTNNVMTKVWLDAGFESAQVDIEARKLVFRRVAKSGEARGHTTSDGRHPMRGALRDITVVPAGVDLTEPADPGWADLLDKKYGTEVR